VSEPAVAKILAQCGVDGLVLTEHHAAQQRPLFRRHARGDSPLGSLAHAIERAGETRPPPPGRPGLLEQQFRGDAPVAEFAAAMPLVVRLGMKTPVGRSFLKEYPFEEAFFWDRAARFRSELAMPLMLLGGINRLDTMRRAMASGFDFVAMGRALLREPDLVARLQAGETDTGICIHCNRCMPTIYTGTRCPVREEAANDGCY
jgi:hypothetical protein